MQRTLFDDERPTPIARPSDPSTSHEAAANVDVTHVQKIALESAKNLCRIYGDCTANEIADVGAGLGVSSAETVRKRIHELVRKGLLVVVGERRCRLTGVKARTFQVKQ